MITLADIQATGLPLTDHGAIAAALSEGRTKLVATEIGNGLVLETIGMDSGNNLLDVIYNDATFRHVKPLLEQGRLRIDSALVRNTLDAMAGANVITQEEADAIKALAVQPDPVSSQEVTQALAGA